MNYREFNNNEVESIFSDYPKNISEKLLYLRELIYRIAEEYDEIGEIEE